MAGWRLGRRLCRRAGWSGELAAVVDEEGEGRRRFEAARLKF